MKRVVFRVDISPTIGTGHFMRMSVLADAFIEMGCECAIFTGEDEPIDYEPYDIIVLDTYLLNDGYISLLRKPRRVLVCYDDNALYKYDCDIILNANLHASELDFRYAGRKPKMLLGTSYALLRNEFKESERAEIREDAKNVFICFGGSDIRNFTAFVIKSLCNIPDIQLTVALGKHTTSDNEALEQKGKNIEILKNPVPLSAVMKRCDIAVTAAGSMVYELAALGLPAIVIPQADNQKLIADHLNKHGLMKALGQWDIVESNTLRDEVVNLLNNYPRRKTESEKLTETVNPHGAMKAAMEILSLHQ